MAPGLGKARQRAPAHELLTLQDDITCAAGIWEDREVVIDRNWVTSRKPDDIPAFDREMRTLFAQARATPGKARAETR